MHPERETRKMEEQNQSRDSINLKVMTQDKNAEYKMLAAQAYQGERPDNKGPLRPVNSVWLMMIVKRRFEFRQDHCDSCMQHVLEVEAEYRETTEEAVALG